jgi:hypothetical protein
MPECVNLTREFMAQLVNLRAQLEAYEMFG